MTPLQKACAQLSLNEDDEPGLQTLQAVASAAPARSLSEEGILELKAGLEGRVRESVLAMLERQALKGVSERPSEAKPRARGPGL